MINSRTDCHALSKEVVNQCELIHHSRLPEVEQIIYYLKKRKMQNGNRGKNKLKVVVLIYSSKSLFLYKHWIGRG